MSAERIRAAQAEGALATLRADNESLRALQGSARSLEDLLQPVRDSLDTLRRAADQAGRERTAAEATITTQITAVQERYQSLETTTRQLAAALARGQTRGQWGEMQLEGLLEHAGLLEGTHFDRQDSRAGADGVDPSRPRGPPAGRRRDPRRREVPVRRLLAGDQRRRSGAA